VLLGTSVLVPVEVIYAALLVPELQSNGNLVAGRNDILPQASCINILNNQALDTVIDAAVVLPISCVQVLPDVLLVTV